MVQLQISEEKNKEQEKQKKEIAKAYGKYAKEFTPKPKYFSNSLKAFFVGGAVCMCALAFQRYLQAKGVSEEDAGAFVTMLFVRHGDSLGEKKDLLEHLDVGD